MIFVYHLSHHIEVFVFKFHFTYKCWLYHRLKVARAQKMSRRCRHYKWSCFFFSTTSEFRYNFLVDLKRWDDINNIDTMRWDAYELLCNEISFFFLEFLGGWQWMNSREGVGTMRGRGAHDDYYDDDPAWTLFHISSHVYIYSPTTCALYAEKYEGVIESRKNKEWKKNNTNTSSTSRLFQLSSLIYCYRIYSRTLYILFSSILLSVRLSKCMSSSVNGLLRCDAVPLLCGLYIFFFARFHFMFRYKTLGLCSLSSMFKVRVFFLICFLFFSLVCFCSVWWRHNICTFFLVLFSKNNQMNSLVLVSWPLLELF